MKNVSRFLSSYLLPLFLFMGSSAALATDTDGDGIPDPYLQLSTGYVHACVVTSFDVSCWGAGTLNTMYDYMNFGQSIVPPILVNPVMVSAGAYNTCALDDHGVHCWGKGFSVPALVNPVAVSVGADHACALDNMGVHCWGDNSYAQTDVPDLSNPVAVGAGDSHSCALDSTGVHCWGDNRFGQITVPELVNPVAVSAGGHHTCALDSLGVHCWGYDLFGQTLVPKLVNPVAVSAGWNHTCALDDTGVHCWGYDRFDQTNVPVLSHPKAVSAGGLFTCALDDKGVHCWGDNQSGQTKVPALPPGDNCPLETNADQLDSDGDGFGDECDPDASDKSGTSVAFAGDFNGDGYGDYVIGIPGYDLPAVPPKKAIKNAGHAEVISGKDDSVLMFVNGVAKNDAMGFSVAGGKDVDADGYDDVVVGAPKARDESNVSVGAVTVLFGPDAVRRKTCFGMTENSLAGYSVALGDFRSIGYAEVIFGAPNFDDGAGYVEVVFVAPGGCSNTGYFYNGAPGGRMGSSVAAGNVDDVPGADIIVGSPQAKDPGKHFRVSGSISVYNHDDQITPFMKKYGEVAKAHFGKSVASGDVNNDGQDDVLAGAPDDENESSIRTGSVTVFSGQSGMQLTKKYGSVAKAGFGNSVAAGDLNGDGVADIISGASKDDSPALPKITKDTGSVTYWGGFYGMILGDVLYGSNTRDYFGSSVSVGDINSDGKADLVIGIPGKDIPATLTTKIIKDAGAVQVVSGASL